MAKPEDTDEPQATPEPENHPLFQHPDWMIGIVLIFGVIALIAGIDNPIWLLIGSPFILVLAIYAWVRFRR